MQKKKYWQLLRHLLFIVVQLRRTLLTIVASQLYGVADVQFTLEWTEYKVDSA